MMATSQPSRSHFDKETAALDDFTSSTLQSMDVDVDESLGVGTSSGPSYRGLGGAAGALTKQQTHKVADLLQDSPRLVPQRNTNNKELIPWEAVNAKATTDGDDQKPKVNSPQVSSPNTPPSTSASSTPKPNSAAAGGQLFPTIPAQVGWPKQLPVGPGLDNLGNTCFLNSAVQCLLHTPPLVRYILTTPHDRETCAMAAKKGFCMHCATKTIMGQSFGGKVRSSYAPNAVVSKLRAIAKHFRLGRQEDSHEFLRFYVDALQNSAIFGKGAKLEQKIKDTTFVHQIFGGRLRSRVLCLSCNHPSDTFDSVLDLSLDIHRLDSIKDALANFVKKDVLKGQNKYKCEKCKKLVVAEKSFSIDRAPMVLTIHLKRFTPTGRKITESVKYPDTLELGPYMSDRSSNPTYKLYGVINHSGGGPHSGHYTADVKAANGQWNRMDDSFVSRSNGAPLNAKTAYVLFYCREQGGALNDIIRAQAGAPHSNGKKRPRDSVGGQNSQDLGTPERGNLHSAKKMHLQQGPPAVIASASLKAAPSPAAVSSPAPLVSKNPFDTNAATQVSPASTKSFYGSSPAQGKSPVQISTKGKIGRVKKMMGRQGKPRVISM